MSDRKKVIRGFNGGWTEAGEFQTRVTGRWYGNDDCSDPYYGDLNMEFKVNGYWSDTMRLQWRWKDPEPSINYGSGGYEADFPAAARARCMAAALEYAAKMHDAWVEAGYVEAWTTYYRMAVDSYEEIE